MARLQTLFPSPFFFVFWIFADPFAEANKHSVAIDIVLAVTIDWPSEEAAWTVTMANKFADQFEMGDDKAKMALVTSVVPTEDKDKADVYLLQQLTANEAEFKNKASEWSKRAFIAGNFEYRQYLALEAAKKIFTKSSSRAKAVFFALPSNLPDDDDKPKMDEASKQLRESGCKIYVMVKKNDPNATAAKAIAEQATGDPKNVFFFNGEMYDQTVADMVPEISTKIAEGAKGGGGHTTTTGGVMVQPPPLLQLLGCVLIGEQLFLRIFPF